MSQSHRTETGPSAHYVCVDPHLLRSFFFLMPDLSQCFSRYFICWKSICLCHLFTQYISKLVIKILSQIPSSLPFYFLLSGQFYIKFVLLPWIFWFLPCWTVFYVVPSQRTFFISAFCKSLLKKNVSKFSWQYPLLTKLCWLFLMNRCLSKCRLILCSIFFQ